MKLNPVSKRILGASACIAGSMALILAYEIYRAINQPVAPYISPSRAARLFGESTAPKLTYVVMGDSTAAGQGAPYDDGIAVSTAKHIAQNNSVTLINLGVSGATIEDVIRVQLPQLAALKPDIVLISVGSNDVTHLVPFGKLSVQMASLLRQIGQLQNPPTVVCTGAGDLGSSPRFLQPLRWIAGYRTMLADDILKQQAEFFGAIWCPLAKITGPAFRRNQSLYGPDNFHPNSAGYAVWTAAIVPSLKIAVHRHFSKQN